MKFIDICAGIGGFRSGLEMAGHECVGYVEIDRHARKSYQAMYDTENEWTATDITEIKPEDMPKADLWCFGFPCQDISVAGRQKGLKGERSGIFYSIIGLLKGKNAEDRPKWLLVENVKNLLSLNGGREFTEVLSEISEAGYDAEWHLVNSKDHGVPQNRERVFIVGRLRDGSGRQVLPLAGAGGQAGGQGQAEQKINVMAEGNHETDTVVSEEGLSKTLKATDHKNPVRVAVPKIKSVNHPNHNGHYIQKADGLSRTVLSRDYKDPQMVAVPKVRAVYTPNFSKMGQQGPRIKEEGEPMFTVRSFSPHGVAVPKQIVSGDQAHRVYDSNGVSVTIKAEGGGVGAKTGLYTVPKIKTIATGDNQRKSVQAEDGIARALTATDYKEPQPVAVPCITPDRVNKRQNGRRFKEPEDPMFTLTAQDRHGVLIGKKFSDKRNNCIHSWDFDLKGECSNDEKKLMQLILDHRRHKEFGKKDGNPLTVEQIKTFAHLDGLEHLLEHLVEMGYLKKTGDKYDISFGQLSFEVNDIVDVEKPITTLTSTDCNRHGVLVYKDEEYYIRRLTPKECFRLQGFSDEQFEKAQSVNSNTQLYKQAGNAVTVNVAYVLGAILKEAEKSETGT